MRYFLLIAFLVFLVSQCSKTPQDQENILPKTDSKTLQSENQGLEGAVSFAKLDVKPKVLKKSLAVYPEDARQAGAGGMVVVKILIDEEGAVSKAVLVKKEPDFPSLDRAALKAAKEFKFTPAKKDGMTVKTWMTIPFTFRLKQNVAE